MDLMQHSFVLRIVLPSVFTYNKFRWVKGKLEKIRINCLEMVSLIHKMSIEKLITLLAKSDPSVLIQRCLNALQDNSTLVSSPGTPTMTQGLIQIYRRRIHMDKELGIFSIDGGEELLTALLQEADERIITYGAESNQEHYIIFTDCSSKRLIGLIGVRKIKDG